MSDYKSLNKKELNKILYRYCLSKGFVPKSLDEQGLLQFFMGETGCVSKPKDVKKYLQQIALLLERHQHHEFDLSST